MIEASGFLNAMDEAEGRWWRRVGRWFAKRESVELHAMINAALIAYARPFTKLQITPERRCAPLADISPPVHLAEFHQDALDLRNTMVGHADATPGRGRKYTPNVVVVSLTSKGGALNSIMIGSMGDPMRSGLKELCAYFIQHCEENLTPLANAFSYEFMKYPPGEYALVVSKSPDDWLIPREAYMKGFKRQ